MSRFLISTESAREDFRGVICQPGNVVDVNFIRVGLSKDIYRHI